MGQQSLTIYFQRFLGTTSFCPPPPPPLCTGQLSDQAQTQLKTIIPLFPSTHYLTQFQKTDHQKYFSVQSTMSHLYFAQCDSCEKTSLLRKRKSQIYFLDSSNQGVTIKVLRDISVKEMLLFPQNPRENQASEGPT